MYLYHVPRPTSNLWSLARSEEKFQFGVWSLEFVERQIFFFWVMADNNFTTKAIELVQQATAADQEKRYLDAFNLYQASLQYFLTSLKYEKNERMREILGAKMSEYMTRGIFSLSLSLSLSLFHFLIFLF